MRLSLFYNGICQWDCPYFINVGLTTIWQSHCTSGVSHRLITLQKRNITSHMFIGSCIYDPLRDNVWSITCHVHHWINLMLYSIAPKQLQNLSILSWCKEWLSSWYVMPLRNGTLCFNTLTSLKAFYFSNSPWKLFCSIIYLVLCIICAMEGSLPAYSNVPSCDHANYNDHKQFWLLPYLITAVELVIIKKSDMSLNWR